MNTKKFVVRVKKIKRPGTTIMVEAEKDLKINKRKEVEVGLEKTRKKLAIIKKTADEVGEFAESLINTVREPLIALDHDLRVVKVSRSFYEFFKVKPEETMGQLIYDLGNEQWNIPRLRELLETILPQKASFDNYEVEHEFASIGRRVMLLNARQIQQKAGKKRIILLAIEDITERKDIEAGLEKTRKELAVIKKTADEASKFAESLINTVREPLISLDQDLRVVSVSRSFYEFFKVKPEETVGKLIYDLGNKQWDIPKLQELLETILPQKASFDNYEVEHEFATIGRRVMLLNARQIQQEAGKKRIILLAIEDITERQHAESQRAAALKALQKSHDELEWNVQERTAELAKANELLQADIIKRKLAEEVIRSSLVEKEVLLKEVHHRVKNNLMTIIGLIKMEGTKANNEIFNALLLELEGRIHSMALVHESLNKSEDLARIDLQNYIETMSAYIHAQFGAKRNILFKMPVAGVEVGLDIAVPCGLILNELIVNAYKHAFPDGKPRSGASNCEIVVNAIHQGDIFTMTVADNGIGLPADMNLENPKTIGLRLIKMLCQQIKGSLELDRSAGTAIRLKFMVN